MVARMGNGNGSPTNGVLRDRYPEIVPNWLAAGFALFLMARRGTGRREGIERAIE